MIDYDSRNWLRIVLRVRGSVLPQLAGRVLATAAVGGVALFLHVRHAVRVPATAHTLLGVALGLLLVFRTNASYDRYWEGRKSFGMITNRARDLMRQATVYVEGDDAAARATRAAVARLLTVFYALVRQHLRGERDLGRLGAPVEPAERAALEPVAVRPNLALVWLTEVLAAAARRAQLSEDRLRAMDGNVTALTDAFGAADRIRKTPIPFAYAQHIKSFLALFCFSAPFALVESMGRATPLVAAVVAFGLFGIEEIGVEIEDPFGYDPNDLPLDRIGETIAADTAAMLAARHAPTPHET